MEGEVRYMPKSADESKKQLVIHATTEQVIDTNTYNSQRRAIKKYESKVEQLTVRLPQGSREQLNEYIKSNGKYSSVNAMIKALLENEIGHSLG